MRILILKNLLKRLDDLKLKQEDERKRMFTAILLCLGFIVVSVMLVDDIIHDRTIEIYAQISVLTIFALNFTLLIFLKNANSIMRLSLFTLGSLLILSAVIGGEHGAKLFWLFMLPPIYYFLLGIREGTIWNLYTLLILAVIFELPFELIFNYPDAVKLRFVLTYTCIILVSFIQESVRHHFYRKVKTEQKRLEKANKKIKQLSITDPLTGAYNRRYLDQCMKDEFRRAVRTCRPLSIVICDIDHFKRINDQFGHQVGDELLKSLVTIMKASLRSELDRLARFGGEEFVIIMPETTSNEALKVTERMRQMIAGAMHNGVRVTASFGIATLNDSASNTPLNVEDLFKRADIALYQAKHAGRNRVVLNTNQDSVEPGGGLAVRIN